MDWFLGRFGALAPAVGFACCVFALPARTPGPRDQDRAVQEVAPPSTRGLIPHWTGIIDTTGHCRYSVPPLWKVEDRSHGNGLAWAADGKATVQQDWLPSSSWTAYTSALRHNLKPTVIRDESPRRFWFEYAAGWPGVHYFVAVPSAGGACAMRIDVRSGVNDLLLVSTIGQIVHSVVALQ